MVSILIRECEGKARLKHNNEDYIITGHKNLDNMLFKRIISNFKNNELVYTIDTNLNMRAGVNPLLLGNTGVLHINGKQAGTIGDERIPDTIEAERKIFLKDSASISIYEIGVGDRYFFFYEGGLPVACAHQDSAIIYTIFANNEWYTHLMAVYLCMELILKEPHFSSQGYYTPQHSILRMYDANYISEILKSEPESVKSKYNHLIHSTVSSEAEIEKAQKHSLHVILFIIILIGLMAILPFVLGIFFS